MKKYGVVTQRTHRGFGHGRGGNATAAIYLWLILFWQQCNEQIAPWWGC